MKGFGPHRHFTYTLEINTKNWLAILHPGLYYPFPLQLVCNCLWKSKTTKPRLMGLGCFVYTMTVLQTNFLFEKWRDLLNNISNSNINSMLDYICISITIWLSILFISEWLLLISSNISLLYSANSNIWRKKSDLFRCNTSTWEVAAVTLHRCVKKMAWSQKNSSHVFFSSRRWTNNKKHMLNLKT